MLTVLLATHNGSDTIERTLAAMAELEPPPGGWKLVVVNNGSTDDTEARVLKWRDRLPMEYVVEPRLGKPIAMNTAFRHVAGDFIVMTDDDVLPDKDWLVAWRRAADCRPEITVFGGAIVPEFEVPPPEWMPVGDYSMFFAATPARGEGEIVAADVFGIHCDVFGPNFAVRRSAIDDQSMFDLNFFIGPLGLMGEDTDFVRRLAARGHKVGFAPMARLRHIVQRSQTTWRWALRRCYRHGKFSFAVSRMSYTDPAKLPPMDFPRWRIRRVIESALALPFVAMQFDSRRLFLHLKRMAYDLGAIDQARLTGLGVWGKAERYDPCRPINQLSQPTIVAHQASASKHQPD